MTSQINIYSLSFFKLMVTCLLLSFIVKVNGNANSTVLLGKNPNTVYRLNNEKKLIADLFANYQVKFGRPVNNMTERVVVYFGIRLIQLIDLDERNQVLITNVHSVYQWKDNGLKWDRKQYGDIEDIRLPVNRIWTPDIVLYNYADTRLEEKRDVMAVVMSDGTVKWRPPSIFKSTCQINIQKFPYDQQNCSMKFGSWTYDGDSIDIQFYENSHHLNLEEYTESNEWEIISADGIRTEKKYECCKEFFPDLTFHIKMRRKGGFYNYILVLPCVLLTLLTSVLFWLPPESPAKMVLGMNIFTSFFVLLLLLSKNVPSATDKIPLIGAYYCLNMGLIAISTCSCTVVVHIFFRGQGQVPTLVRRIFLEFLARIFCMVIPPLLPPAPPPKKASVNHKPPATIITSLNNTNVQSNGNLTHQINRPPNNNRLNQANSISCTALNTADENSQLLGNSSQNQQLMGNIQNMPSHTHSSGYHQQPSFQQQSSQLTNELSLSFNLIENDIKEIRDYLRHTRKKLETTDAKSKQTNEWKQVALVLDRTLFFIYILAVITSFAVMFHNI